MFTVVPAAFISTVPARLLIDFAWDDAITLLLAGICFVAIGWTTFQLGLRRYSSGSAWTRG